MENFKVKHISRIQEERGEKYYVKMEKSLNN